MTDLKLHPMKTCELCKEGGRWEQSGTWRDRYCDKCCRKLRKLRYDWKPITQL
jgi:hypothetical protein